MHDCGRFRWPATNKEYWISKITRNTERDRQHEEELQSLGWNVIVVWECEIKKDLDNTMHYVIELLRINIESREDKCKI